MKNLFKISAVCIGIWISFVSAEFRLERCTKIHKDFQAVQDLIGKTVKPVELLDEMKKDFDDNKYACHMLYDNNKFVGFVVFGSVLEKNVTIDFKSAVLIKGIFLFKNDRTLHNIYARELWNSVVMQAACMQADSIVVKILKTLTMDVSFYKEQTGIYCSTEVEHIFGCKIVYEGISSAFFNELSKAQFMYFENQNHDSWHMKNYVVFLDRISNKKDFCIGYVRRVTPTGAPGNGFDYDLMMLQDKLSLS